MHLIIGVQKTKTEPKQKVSNSQQKSIDVLPSKNQALCKFCTHVNQLKHC